MLTFIWLKKRNYRIISNDILYSNYSLAKAIIENNNEKLLLDITEEKLEKYFDRGTYEKIRWLENNLYFDYEVKELSMLINYSKSLKKYKKYIFYLCWDVQWLEKFLIQEWISNGKKL